LMPVQDHALSGSAMSVAPRFKRSSETNTQITLNASWSHGLPKPEGRSCIGLFLMSFVMSSEVETSLLLLVGEPWKRKRNSKRFLHFGRNDNDASDEDGGEIRADRR
jgi:hypothetical protein